MTDSRHAVTLEPDEEANIAANQKAVPLVPRFFERPVVGVLPPTLLAPVTTVRVPRRPSLSRQASLSMALRASRLQPSGVNGTLPFNADTSATLPSYSTEGTTFAPYGVSLTSPLVEVDASIGRPTPTTALFAGTRQERPRAGHTGAFVVSRLSETARVRGRGVPYPLLATPDGPLTESEGTPIWVRA